MELVSKNTPTNPDVQGGLVRMSQKQIWALVGLLLLLLGLLVGGQIIHRQQLQAARQTLDGAQQRLQEQAGNLERMHQSVEAQAGQLRDLQQQVDDLSAELDQLQGRAAHARPRP